MISFIQRLLGRRERPASKPLDFNDLERINEQETRDRTGGGTDTRRTRKSNPERQQSRPRFLG